MCQKKLESKRQRKLNVVLLASMIVYIVITYLNRDIQVSNFGVRIVCKNVWLDTCIFLLYFLATFIILDLKWIYPKDYCYTFVVQKMYIQISDKRQTRRIDRNFHVCRNLVDDQLILTSVLDPEKRVTITYSQEIFDFLKSNSFWDISLKEIEEFNH